jgi:hypothetical protein
MAVVGTRWSSGDPRRSHVVLCPPGEVDRVVARRIHLRARERAGEGSFEARARRLPAGGGIGELPGLDVSSDNVDFVTDRTALAVRRGPLHDSSLVALELEDAAVGTFAHPSDLARAGTPAHPGELARHVCIPFVLPRTGRTIAWGFVAGRRGVTVGNDTGSATRHVCPRGLRRIRYI